MIDNDAATLGGKPQVPCHGGVLEVGRRQDRSGPKSKSGNDLSGSRESDEGSESSTPRRSTLT
jgi:hypothetical protein